MMLRLPTPLLLRNGCHMSAVQAHDVSEPDWMDELVELHVLAANGDAAAASAAERWMAADPAVRKAWTQVEATCDRVREAENVTATR
jgi:ferric-dicitrate binding protein FerR (iron transport regulator)